MIEDLVNSGRSILLLGRPGVGKTTMLREMARVLSEAGQRVIVVDTLPRNALGKVLKRELRARYG